MLILPPKPGAKPNRVAEFLAMVFCAIFAVGGLVFLTRPIPAREALERFDASAVPLEITGQDFYTLTIRSAPNTELRHLNLDATNASLLRNLVPGQHRVAVLSAPNAFYLAWLWGGPQYDRMIMELAVDNQVIVSYDESVAALKATRWQGIIVMTLSLGYTIWWSIRRVRHHTFAPKPAGDSLP